MIEFQYRFHAAGQGLFASGTLVGINSSFGNFHWVFDCGSVSYSTVLRPVVSRYRELVIGNQLDLLCISHFDNDHVSGISDLLSGLHVNTVVIPYYSQLERLLIGSTSISPTATYLAFLSNPIAFILERAASVDKIIIVGGPQEETDDLALPGRPPEEPSGNHQDYSERRWRESSWHLKPSKGTELDTRLVVDAATLGLAQQTGTHLLAFTESLETLAVHPQFAFGWEFLFFHKPIDPTFREALLKKMRAILATSSDARRRQTLGDVLKSKTLRDQIKKAYNSSIRGREDINSTSLCVYTGPQLDLLQGSSISRPWPDSLMVLPRRFHSYYNEHAENCSLLYTGDANLKLSENRRELRNFITLNRWQSISVLQVPHHGSKNNWEPGAVREFSHSFSIFCADETHRGYKHPDGEVVLDLLYRGPHLANKSQSWSLGGVAYFE